MNILQVEKYYWPQGGASRYALDLSDSLEEDGHRVIPFASVHSGNLPSSFSKYFVPALAWSGYGKASLWKKVQYAGHIMYSFDARTKMNELLGANPVDVAHLHTIYHQISPSILPVLRKRGIPIVMTLHDYKLLTPNYTFFHHGEIHEEDGRGWYLSCIKNKCFKDGRLPSTLITAEMIFHHKIMRYYERYVDLFLAPSVFIRDLFIRFGWDPKKIEHVPLPISVPANPSISGGGSFVAYVGRLVEEKGLLVLLSAARQTPGIRYMLVGDGPLRPMIQAYIRKYGLKNVEVAGFKQEKAVREIVSQARLLVAPSVWYENYPLSVLEAKAAGKVVVASSIGGLPEMLPAELLVSPNNPDMLAQTIQKWFAASDEELARVGASLRNEVAQKNDAALHRETVLSLYNRVMGR